MGIQHLLSRITVRGSTVAPPCGRYHHYIWSGDHTAIRARNQGESQPGPIYPHHGLICRQTRPYKLVGIFRIRSGIEISRIPTTDKISHANIKCAFWRFKVRFAARGVHINQLKTVVIAFYANYNVISRHVNVTPTSHPASTVHIYLLNLNS